ncbi:NAD(P)-dependent oxidoreductase [Devosia sp.]|uniref:NAD(P)-dependent oxidoreductase n=1 Tax=Devosia sp. TaxID=1871048 RepID=UPI003A95968C
MTQTDPIAPPARIVVFGATGKTGLEVLRQGKARGFTMVGVDVHKSDDVPDDCEQIVANVLEDDLTPALEGASAVISCLGVGNSVGTLLDPPPLYSKGTGRIIEAMGKAGIERIVVISATMVAADDRGPLLFRLGTTPALTRVLDEMADMERQLAESTLEWTAARPGWLLDKPATHDVVVSEGKIAEGLIRTRIADLAGVMLDCVENGTYARGYPAPARKEADEDEGNQAVLNSMMA